MYPDLSYLFHDLFGTPVDNWLSVFKTFGLFLAVAILSAALLLKIELKRMSRQGVFKPKEEAYVVGKAASFWELAGSFLFGFAFGYKLGYVFTHFAEFQSDAPGVLISWKGSWLWGLLLGGFWALLNFFEKKSRELPKPEEKVRKIYPHHRIGDITIIAALTGITGAKLFDLFEHLDEFWQDPLGLIFSGGGLAIYGGLILGFAAVVLYLYANKVPVRPVMDAAAPSLVLGYGVGRLGCHFSGDGDWGIVNNMPVPDWWFFPDWLWAFRYPRNILKEGVPIPGCTGEFCMQLSEPVFPTPIYEVGMALVLLIILMLIRKKMPVWGMLFFVSLILNAITRYSIEAIRVNVRYSSFLNFTQAELISMGLLLVGVIGLAYLYINRERLGRKTVGAGKTA
jgi:phosphatidylglycerol:prolipoprotein diacylglycerol transferase